MDKLDIVELTGRHGLLAAIGLQRAQDAIPLGQAMLEGGLTVGEVTFRTEAAAEGLSLLAKTYPAMTVGAGSIIFIEQAKQALDAGARFIVSAGFYPELVDWCLAKGVPVLPGVATASEIMQAVVRKLSAVKFFPAGVLGGTAAISALSAPFPGLKFVPMGGVSAANMAEYLRLPAVHAIGGSWLVGSELVSAGKFSEVTRLVREALDIYKEARRV